MVDGLAMLATLSAGALALGVLRHFAPRWGWVDRPDGRKPHVGAVPPVGGAAWLCAWLTGLALLAQAGAIGGHAMWLAGLVTAIALLGWVDDRWHVSVRLRFALQALIVALAAQWPGIRLDDLGQLLWTGWALDLGWLALPMTIFAVVGVINAINMFDGMDGLCGVLTASTCAVLAALAGPAHEWFWPLLLAAIALLPFLALNLRRPGLPRARVFLGDAGALALGLLLGLALVDLSQGSAARFPPVLALYLLALPLVDTVSVMWRRMSAGHSPFAPDQQHLHHLLQRAGHSVSRTLLLLCAVAWLSMAAGWTMWRLGAPDALLLGVFLLAAFSFHAWIRAAIQRGRLLGRVLAERVPTGVAP